MNTQIAALPLACWLVMAGAGLAADAPRTSAASADTARTTNAASSLPTGAEVIQRVLERSAALAAATNTPVWAYDKITVMEKLNGDAEVEERTEKQHRVRMIQGVPFSRLVKVEGRALTEAEIKKEDEREKEFQKRISGRDPKKVVAERESLITKELMDRFSFTVLRREAVHGRPTVVVSFAAKPGKDGGSVQDRVLSRLAGTLWVDEASADVARLEVWLTKGFSMGVLGMLGSIKDCRMDLHARPMSDGTWLPEKTKLSISARMFVTSVRFKLEETSSGYMLEPAETPAEKR